jgi:hypothetical protein
MYPSAISKLRKFTFHRFSINHRTAIFGFFLILLLLPPFVRAQTTGSSTTASAGCPIRFMNFSPGGAFWLNTRIKNTSGRTIVGLVFNAALSDATEHWKWYHWEFDDARPIHDFDWNRKIKSGETKRLSWDQVDLKFEHGGGVAFVLTSALFDDGSIWEESADQAACRYVWYNHHKEALVRPVVLPFRQ